MKLTKSLVILPLLALCLAGCVDSTTVENTTEGETSSASGETSQPSEGGTDSSTGDQTTGSKEDCSVVFTFYDTNGAAQKCPSYGSLYMNGNFDDPTSGDWGLSYIKLTETTDLSGNTAYTYTFDSLVPGASYAFNVVFTYEGDDPAWNPVRDENFNAVLFSSTNEGDTEYISLTGCYTFDSRFGLKTGSCTIAVKDTADNGNKSLKISGDMQGWQPTVMTYNASNTEYQYSYTFDASENMALEFGIFTLDSWSDSIQLATGYTNEYVTGTGANLKINGNAIGTNSYTLIVFTVDGTNFGVTDADHVRATAITITH